MKKRIFLTVGLVIGVPLCFFAFQLRIRQATAEEAAVGAMLLFALLAVFSAILILDGTIDAKKRKKKSEHNENVGCYRMKTKSET